MSRGERGCIDYYFKPNLCLLLNWFTLPQFRLMPPPNVLCNCIFLCHTVSFWLPDASPCAQSTFPPPPHHERFKLLTSPGKILPPEISSKHSAFVLWLVSISQTSSLCHFPPFPTSSRDCLFILMMAPFKHIIVLTPLTKIKSYEL